MKKSLASLIDSVANLDVAGRDRQAIVGGILGALYCLRKAAELSHEDRTGTQLPADYQRELQAVAADLERGVEVSQRKWLATLYFNSGVHRLHLSSERFEALRKRQARSSKNARRGARKPPGDPIKADVDKQKHEPQGLLDGRRANWPEVLNTFQSFCNELSKHWRAGPASDAG